MCSLGGVYAMFFSLRFFAVDLGISSPNHCSPISQANLMHLEKTFYEFVKLGL